MEERALERTYAVEAAVAHRFRFAADILEGMTDGIDGERLGALVRWALRGQVGADEREALIRIFAAPWIAAFEAGEWEGDERLAAEDDIARITAQADSILTARAPRLAPETVARVRELATRYGKVVVTPPLQRQAERDILAVCDAVDGRLP